LKEDIGVKSVAMDPIAAKTTGKLVVRTMSEKKRHLPFMAANS
jgi:hypothetical protein